jgi:hypothetical protein
MLEMLQQLLQEAPSGSVRQEACLSLGDSQEALRMLCVDAKMNDVFLSKRGVEHEMKLGYLSVVDDSPLFLSVSSLVKKIESKLLAFEEC